jgi:hypothetical protein
VVWSRGGAFSEECPKSLVTPESIALLEGFYARKAWGGSRCDEMTAREADACALLEAEWRAETPKHGQ